MSREPDAPFARESMRDYGDDPWQISVTGLDPAFAGLDETLFSLGNGYLGLRGNYEEGLPFSSHGTFVNGLHESWLIEHPEHAYGFAEHGQAMINAPDTKTIRVYVDDERLNLLTSEIRDVTRTLDMRDGTLTRSLLWLTSTGKRVRVETRRMVSFMSRHMATLEMRVTVLDADANVTFNSLIVNRQDLDRVENGADLSRVTLIDPRKGAKLRERILDPGPARQEGTRSVMSFRVRTSGMVLGVAADHSLEGGTAWQNRVEPASERVRHVFQGVAPEGQTVTLVKTVAYHSSTSAALPEMLDRCVQTLEQVAAEPAEMRWQTQRTFLDDFWRRTDVEVDADPEVQQAIRWNLFQVAQAGARADGRGIPAKGLTGSGYGGHYFWDSEIYVLPMLTYTTPLWSRNALRSREHMLPQARTRAMILNEDGALFPWRTINGEEASAYYAAGTAAYHINADITYAIARYVAATGDLDYLLAGACDIVVETARLWNSLGFWRRERNGDERFHIHGVTGPDEYTAVVNDNLFTNVMARFNLRVAVETVELIANESPEAHRDMCERLSLDAQEIDDWARAAEGMFIPFSEDMQIHPQDAHFLEKEVWDLAATPPERKPLLLNFHPLVIYRFQVIKQTDVVLAQLLDNTAFSREQKQRDFEYYDALTTGDSTLSAVVQSIIAAEVGYRELAYRYFDHAVHVDLADLHRNTIDGVHIASAGGVWMSLVQGFAGMRDSRRRLEFDPRLPTRWNRLSFSLAWWGQRIAVRVETNQISFELVEGDTEMTVWVRDEAVRVIPGRVSVVALADQGPDLGPFRGLSAGILPREGDIESPRRLPSVRDSAPYTSPVPTRPPPDQGTVTG